MRVQGAAGEGLLIHFLAEKSVYSSTSLDSSSDYQARARAYAAPVASAIKYWAGGLAARGAVAVYPTLAQIAAACEQWSGGDPANDLFSPRYFKGHRLAATSRSIPALPRLLHGKNAEFTLPQGVVPGGQVKVNVFGEDVTLQLPENAAAGYLMKCRLVEGVLSVVMVMAASSAHAATAGLLA
mmetsp:Transcript_32729/g.77884  ORF Transcript_32729/g.77884 Transcript_32729/m.77884 type:complete len:183 (+) Transcript_32729:2-550(+)